MIGVVPGTIVVTHGLLTRRERSRATRLAGRRSTPRSWLVLAPVFLCALLIVLHLVIAAAVLVIWLLLALVGLGALPWWQDRRRLRQLDPSLRVRWEFGPGQVAIVHSAGSSIRPWSGVQRLILAGDLMVLVTRSPGRSVLAMRTGQIPADQLGLIRLWATRAGVLVDPPLEPLGPGGPAAGPWWRPDSGAGTGTGTGAGWRPAPRPPAESLVASPPPAPWSGIAVTAGAVRWKFTPSGFRLSVPGRTFVHSWAAFAQLAVRDGRMVLTARSGRGSIALRTAWLSPAQLDAVCAWAAAGDLYVARAHPAELPADRLSAGQFPSGQPSADPLSAAGATAGTARGPAGGTPGEESIGSEAALDPELTLPGPRERVVVRVTDSPREALAIGSAALDRWFWLRSLGPAVIATRFAAVRALHRWRSVERPRRAQPEGHLFCFDAQGYAVITPAAATRILWSEVERIHRCAGILAVRQRPPSNLDGVPLRALSAAEAARLLRWAGAAGVRIPGAGGMHRGPRHPSAETGS